MMEPTVKIARVAGIELNLGYSWFLIFIFATIVMAMQFEAYFPDWLPIQRYLWGLATSLLFFVSILLHEIAHSVVALHHNIRVHSIMLHVFGGWARLSRPARNAFEELTIAVAGPLSSFGLALLFGGIWVFVDETSPLSLLSGRLSIINLVLAIFNILPGFPLDGGLVLRAMLWYYTDNYNVATRTAAYISQLLAAAFMICGVLLFINLGLIGLWFIMIAYNFYSSARGHLQEVKIKESFQGYRVGDLALEQLPQVSGRTSVSELEQSYVPMHGCFLVVDEGRVSGVINTTQVCAVEEPHRPFVSVDQVMTPIHRFEILNPETNVVQALELMDCTETTQLPVVENQQLQGFIGRESLVNFIRSRFELTPNM